MGRFQLCLYTRNQKSGYNRVFGPSLHRAAGGLSRAMVSHSIIEIIEPPQCLRVNPEFNVLSLTGSYSYSYSFNSRSRSRSRSSSSSSSI